MSGNSAAQTPHLLHSVLLLLDLLSGALSLLLQAVLWLREMTISESAMCTRAKITEAERTYSGQSILRFELLGGLQVVVNQGKASGASSTEHGAETE